MNYHACMATIIPVTCSDDLPIITNGGITYAGGSTNNRPLGATAMYICFRPYRLVGVSVRTCESNGTWSSSTAPVCQREWNRVWTICVFRLFPACMQV